ncbi:MAG TPA: hypothetical protein VG076_15315 [Acidimicrobiales bacterium]|jgi:hypothetical protein|nr:hypothetical protein [Acidimicrobiales bacterium]
MLLADITGGAFKVVLVLHLLTVVIGFGGITLIGFVGASSQRYPGPAGQAVFDTSQRLGKVAEYFIYAVPVFGIALLFISTTNGNHVYWWDQAWVSASLLIYILTIGFVHSLHLPNLKKMGELMAEMNAAPPPSGGPPPQVAELQERGKRAGLYGAISNLAWVVVLILMVWKPGL